MRAASKAKHFASGAHVAQPTLFARALAPSEPHSDSESADELGPHRRRSRHSGANPSRNAIASWRSPGSTPRCETRGRVRTRTFVLFLLRLVVKKDWIAAIVIVLLGAVGTTGDDYFWSTSLFSAVIWPSIYLVLRRFGLLALVVGLDRCRIPWWPSR